MHIPRSKMIELRALGFIFTVMVGLWLVSMARWLTW